jgi:integrase
MSRHLETRRNLTPAAPRNLTAIAISKLKPGRERYEVRDGILRGLRVIVQPSGYKSFHLRLWYRNKGYNIALGEWLDMPATSSDPVIGGPLTLADARLLAAQCLRQIKSGTHPATLKQSHAADEDSVESIAAAYMKREGPRLRRAGQRQHDISTICKSLGTRLIAQVKLSDLVRLRDKIEENSGPMAARRVLTSWQALAAWHASRADDFRPPIIPRGVAPKAISRDRILTDDEIRAVWKAADAYDGSFGYYVKFVLLTATRREEANGMRRGELVTPDTWVIPAARCKTKRDVTIPLSRAAQDVLDSVTVIAPGDFVFTVDGRRPLGSIHRNKLALDAASGTNGWTIHDLRRTARTLLSRAGVDADTAERCLGHAIQGVRATYDRHKFEQEMRDAFERLATLVETIVLGPTKNVVAIRGRA